MPGEKRYLGVGLEYYFGSGAYPNHYLDPRSIGLDVPSDAVIEYEGIGGRVNSIAIPGSYIPSGQIEVGVDPVSIGALLKAAMGSIKTIGTNGVATATSLSAAAIPGDTTITVDGEEGFSVDDYVQLEVDFSGQAEIVQIEALDESSTAPYIWTLVQEVQNDHDSGAEVQQVTAPFVHSFTLTKERSVPSLALRIGRQIMEHQFFGVVIGQIAFEVQSEFLTATIDFLAQKDVKADLDQNSKSLPGSLFNAREISFMKWVNRDQDLLVDALQFSLSCNNNISTENSIRFGSRFPKAFEVGGAEISSSCRLAFSDTRQYEHFWGSAAGPDEQSVVTDQLKLEFTKGTNELSFIFPRAYIQQASAPVSGRDQIIQDVSIRPLYDNTFFSAFNVDLVNSVTRYN